MLCNLDERSSECKIYRMLHFEFPSQKEELCSFEECRTLLMLDGQLLFSRHVPDMKSPEWRTEREAAWCQHIAGLCIKT